MTPSRKTFTLAAMLLASAACSAGGTGSVGTGTGGSGTSSSTTGTGGAGGAGPTAEQACADLAKATCAKRDACSSGFQISRLFGDLGTCEARTAALCVANLGAVGTGQTPTKIEACVAAYADFACVDFFDSAPPEACVPPAGEGATGAPCTTSSQCASTFCDATANVICGSCQPLPVAGASCAVQADCGRDLGCARLATAAAGVCAPWVEQGGACLAGAKPCKAGLSCVAEDLMTSTSGTCQPAGAAIGAACDGSRKTMPGCDNNLGLVCIPAMKGSAVGTCQAIQIVVAGATCGDIGSKPITGFSVCGGSALCTKVMASDPTGTCVAPAADGAPCDIDPTKGPPCLAPSKCVIKDAMGTAGTCSAPEVGACP